MKPMTILMAGVLLFWPTLLWADSATEIDHLIAYVRGSKATFIRNGQESTPEEAANHIQKKREHFRKEIKTAEDFITQAASQSLMTGKPYLVRTEDGQTQAFHNGFWPSLSDFANPTRARSAHPSSRAPRSRAQVDCRRWHVMKTGMKTHLKRGSKRARHIHVDVRAIAATLHRCTGCATTAACCCAKYEVCVSAREMSAIIGALPLAAEYCPWLKGEDGFDNVFDETERGCFAIDTHADGLCVLAYSCDAGIRCSLHSVAEQIGVAPHRLKPIACTLWPLSLQEPPDATLSICDDVFRFPCNRRNGKGGPFRPRSSTRSRICWAKRRAPRS